MDMNKKYNKEYNRLSDFFYIINGVASSNYIISDYRVNKNFIPYIRPSKLQSTSYSGFINKLDVPETKIFSKDTLYVSTNGAGSHTYSYVSIEEFVPNSDVAVLVPKIDLNLEEKLVIATIITENRFKFSYGRKPKGDRLLSIEIPSLNKIKEYAKQLKKLEINNTLYDIGNIKNIINNINYSQLLRLDSIFDIKNGLSSSNVVIQDEKISVNHIPYIRPSKRQSKSYAGYIDKTTVNKDKIYPKNTLYVSTDGAGSHTYSYVSIEEFIPNSNVSVLIPKKDMSLEIKLLYAAHITANRFKFSYGRKPKGERLAELRLPIIEK